MLLCMQGAYRINVPGGFYNNAEGEMTTFAQYYNLPVLSLRACCWKLMAGNVTGMSSFVNSHQHRLLSINCVCLTGALCKGGGE
jgi:hypothetical protein